MNHIGVLHRKIPKFRVLQRTNLSSRRRIKFILYFYFFFSRQKQKFSRLARSKSLSSSFPNLRNSISRESWCGGRLYLESRSLETARTARRPHKNGRCVPRRLNKSNECRKHDEYASETCMDSARVNGPSPLPRHVRRVYPTGGRFPQNSSHVKRSRRKVFFFLPSPRITSRPGNSTRVRGSLRITRSSGNVSIFNSYVEKIYRVIKNKVYI